VFEEVLPFDQQLGILSDTLVQYGPHPGPQDRNQNKKQGTRWAAGDGKTQSTPSAITRSCHPRHQRHGLSLAVSNERPQIIGEPRVYAQNAEGESRRLLRPKFGRNNPPLKVTLEAFMRVLGIDCGTEYTGYGIVELPADESLSISRCAEERLQCVVCGAIRVSPRDPMPTRLSQISRALEDLMAVHHPDCVAIEDVFYAVNVKSALKLGQVRGVAMLAAASAGLEVSEYAPLSIKSAVVGYGKAEKHQVQQMVARLLRLDEIPEPADAADALAIAICHLHTAATLERQRGTSRAVAR